MSHKATSMTGSPLVVQATITCRCPTKSSNMQQTNTIYWLHGTPCGHTQQPPWGSGGPHRNRCWTGSPSALMHLCMRSSSWTPPKAFCTGHKHPPCTCHTQTAAPLALSSSRCKYPCPSPAHTHRLECCCDCTQMQRCLHCPAAIASLPTEVLHTGTFACMTNTGHVPQVTTVLCFVGLVCLMTCKLVGIRPRRHLHSQLNTL